MHQSLGVKVNSILIFVILLFSLSYSNQLILNEDFESGQNGWDFYVDENGTAESWIMDEFGSKVMHAYVSNTGFENWHVHLRKDGFAIEKGKSYVVSVDLRTEDDFERYVELRVEKATLPYTNYSDLTPFKITDEFKTYTFNFTMEHDTDLQAGFCIEMGYFAADTDPLDVIIDNVSITEIDNPVPVVGITSPSDGLVTNKNPLPVTWVVNGFEQSTELIENLVEGLNKIVRTYTDSYGQTGKDSVSVTLDTRAPIVEIHLPLNGYMTNDTVIDVAWSIDGVVQDTLTTERLLKEGSNGVYRSATDEAGNTDGVDITVWRDTQDPDVQIISPEDGSFTNQSTIDIVWTMDGLTQINDLTEELVEGPNTIIRTFTEHVGNTGADTITVTLDTQVPVVAIISPVDGYLTNNASQQITWTVDGVVQTTNLSETLIEGSNVITRSFTDAAGNVGIANITVTLDTQVPVVAITSPADGMITNENSIAISWTVDGVVQTTNLTETLGEGANVITRSITDAAGNVGTANITVTLDTQAPVVIITSPLDGLVTNENPIAITWTVDGVIQTTNLSETLVEGANVITRSITDVAGNVGTANITVTLDTQAPVVTITSPLDGLVTNENPIAITWTVDGVAQTANLTESLVEGANVVNRSITDAAGNVGNASITVTLDTQAPFVAITSPVDGLITNENPLAIAWTADGIAQTTDLTETLVEGANVITRSVTDAAGNVGTANITVTLDTQVPVVAITSPADGLVTNTNPLEVTWTVDGVTQTIDLSESLVEGTNIISRSFTDTAGNVGSANITVTLDTQAPVVTITSPADGLVTNTNPLEVTWTVDGVTQTIDLSESLVEGTNIISRSFTDAAGNVGSANITVTLDTQAPVIEITSPTDGYVTNTSPISVSWTVDGVVQTTELTQELIEGNNTITRSFTDGAGNIGSNSIVVKLDTQAPIVEISSPVDGFVTNQSPITIVWTIDGVAQTTDLTQELNEGINTITRSVSDGAGNIGTATISVELDTQVPVVEITSPVDGFVATSTPVSIAWSVDGIHQTTDLSEELLVGNNTITRSFTDNAGNTGTASIEVTYEVYEPSVEIISPVNSEVFSGLNVDVEWKIDGVLQTTNLSETFDELGHYEIVREFESGDGNTYADTVCVYVGVDTVFADDSVFIDAAKTDLDNKNIYFEGCNVFVKGEHRFNSIRSVYTRFHIDSSLSLSHLIADSGTILSHPPTTLTKEYSLDIQADDIKMINNSIVEVSGLGYSGDYFNSETNSWIGARTRDNEVVDEISNEFKAGGSYGTMGDNPESNSEAQMPIYGDRFYPFELGSGGGADRINVNERGGSGGGRVKINAQRFYMEEYTRIIANGIPGSGNGAGGSGGSILIIADTILGDYLTLHAYPMDHILAGAGRIAIYTNSSLPEKREIVSTLNFPRGSFYSDIIPDSIRVIGTPGNMVGYAPFETDIIVDGWSQNNDIIFYRIDINADGVWDSISTEPFRSDLSFDTSGLYNVILEIEDGAGKIKRERFSFVAEDSSFYSSFEVEYGSSDSSSDYGLLIHGSSNVDSINLYRNELGSITKINGNTSDSIHPYHPIDDLPAGKNVLLIELYSGDSITKKGLEVNNNPRISTDFEPYSVVYPYHYINEFRPTNELYLDSFKKVRYKTAELGLDSSELGDYCIGYSYDQLLNSTGNSEIEYCLSQPCSTISFNLHFNNYNKFYPGYAVCQLFIDCQSDDSIWFNIKQIDFKDGLVDYRNIELDLSRYSKVISKIRWRISPIYDDGDYINKTGCYIGKLKCTVKEKLDCLSVPFVIDDSLEMNYSAILKGHGKQFALWDTVINGMIFNSIVPIYWGDYLKIENYENSFLESNTTLPISYDSSGVLLTNDTLVSEGDVQVNMSFIDEFGNVIFDNVHGIVDQTPPVITIISPTIGDTLFTSNGYVNIKYRVDDDVMTLDTVLFEGNNIFTIEAIDRMGLTSTIPVSYYVIKNNNESTSRVTIQSPDSDCNTLAPKVVCVLEEKENLEMESLSVELNGEDITQQFTISNDSIFCDLDSLKRGNYYLSISFMDKFGSQISDSLDFIVNAPTALGTVSDTIGYAPFKVSFACNGYYPENDIDWYRWDVDNDNNYEFTSRKQDKYEHTFEKPGDYVAKFQIISSDGLTATNYVNIKVNNPVPIPPKAVLHTTKSSGESPLSTRFYGNGIKEKGRIVYHEWDIDGDGVFELSHQISNDTSNVYSEYFDEVIDGWNSDINGGTEFKQVLISDSITNDDSVWVTNVVSTSDGKQVMRSRYFSYAELSSCSLFIGSFGEEKTYIDLRLKGFEDSIITDWSSDKYYAPTYTKHSATQAVLTDLIDTLNDSLCFYIYSLRYSYHPVTYLDTFCLWSNIDTFYNEGAKSTGLYKLQPENLQWYKTSKPINLQMQGKGWLCLDSTSYPYSSNTYARITSPEIQLPDSVDDVICSLSLYLDIADGDYFTISILLEGETRIIDRIQKDYLGNNGIHNRGYGLSPGIGKSVRLIFEFESDSLHNAGGISLDNLEIFSVKYGSLQNEKNVEEQVQCRDFAKGGDTLAWERSGTDGFEISNLNGGQGVVNTFIESDFIPIKSSDNIIRINYSKPRRDDINVDNYDFKLLGSIDGKTFLKIKDYSGHKISNNDPLSKIKIEEVKLPQIFSGKDVKFRLQFNTNDSDTSDLYYLYLKDKFEVLSEENKSFAEKTYSSVGQHGFSGFRVIDNDGLMDTATAVVTVVEKDSNFITSMIEDVTNQLAPVSVTGEVIWQNSNNQTISKLLWSKDGIDNVVCEDTFYYSQNELDSIVRITQDYKNIYAEENEVVSYHFTYRYGGQYNPHIIAIDQNGDSTISKFNLNIQDTFPTVLSRVTGAYSMNSLTFQPELSEFSSIYLFSKDSTYITIKITDYDGNVVRNLVDSVLYSYSEPKYIVPSMDYDDLWLSDSVNWDGKDDNGELVADGPYRVLTSYYLDGKWNNVSVKKGGAFHDSKAQFHYNNPIQNKISPLRNIQGFAVVDVPYTMFIEIMVGGSYSGERLRTIQEPRIMGAGRYKFYWDGFTSDGSIVNNMPRFDEKTNFVVGQSAFSVDDNVVYVKRSTPEVSNIQISPVEFFPFNEQYDSTGNRNDITISYSISQLTANVICEIIETKTSNIIWKKTWNDVSAGTHSFKWNGKDMSGNYMDHGNYQIRLKAKTGYSESMWRSGIVRILFNYHEAR